MCVSQTHCYIKRNVMTYLETALIKPTKLVSSFLIKKKIIKHSFSENSCIIKSLQLV